MPPRYKNHDKVGRCIYCKSADEPLTAEHIYPYSLNGEFILASASCRACQDETTKIEDYISRRYLLRFRAKRNFKTSNRKKRPKEFSLKAGKTKEDAVNVEVSASIYPALVCLPLLRQATILTGESPSNNSGPCSFICCVDTTGLPQLAARPGEKFFSVENNFNVDIFMRFLAKVAQGGLVTALGLDGYTSFLPEIILGRSKLFFHYIGCTENDEAYQKDKRADITVNFRQVPNKREYHIIVEIRNILPIKSCPIYEVVAGSCDADAFEGAAAQWCDRQVIRRQTANYSKRAMEYTHVIYAFGAAAAAIKNVDCQRILLDGNRIVETRFSLNILPRP